MSTTHGMQLSLDWERKGKSRFAYPSRTAGQSKPEQTGTLKGVIVPDRGRTYVTAIVDIDGCCVFHNDATYQYREVALVFKTGRIRSDTNIGDRELRRRITSNAASWIEIYGLRNEAVRVGQSDEIGTKMLEE